MAMGRQKGRRQADLWVATDALPTSPGHPFYERLNQLLAAAGFDALCEDLCQKFYAEKMGRPSIAPGVYFRMLMIGYFEKLDSERQIAWRCADSLSLRAFLGLASGDGSPDDSSINRARLRIDRETHQAVFDWVLKRLAEHELLKGKTLGVDGSTMEANAAMRSIVRRETGQSYREYLEELAKASGIATPTAEDLARLDRKRKGKKCSNKEWFNPNDPEAKVAKMKGLGEGDVIAEAICGKLGIEPIRIKTINSKNNGDPKKIVNEQELNRFLAEGWDVQTVLPSGKILIQKVNT